MAKLSAYGQQEIVRVSKELPGDGNHTVKEKQEYAVMSNGRVLERRIVWFPAGPYDNGKAQRHDYGWKIRMAAGRASLAKVRPWVTKHEVAGWTVTRGPAWSLLPASTNNEETIA